MKREDLAVLVGRGASHVEGQGLYFEAELRRGMNVAQSGPRFGMNDGAPAFPGMRSSWKACKNLRLARTPGMNCPQIPLPV